jgi:RHS repeat-associated protein
MVQTSLKLNSGMTPGQKSYLYDGMGNQVRDIMNTGSGYDTTYHVYDAHNMQVAVYHMQTPTDSGSDRLGVTERYLYGSDKLGTIKGTNIVALGYVTGPSADKEYEIHDHLGNVRATVKGTPPSLGHAYELNYYNYYAFGSYEPNRTFEVGAPYSFGFNGQEKKDDWLGPGNSLQFKYREYDDRIGRFTSLDLLAKKYPWNSPYAFCENRVIQGKDLEGREFSPQNKTIGRDNTAVLMMPSIGSLAKFL